MSFPNNEVWQFIVEWFDPHPQMKRQYMLKYYVEGHLVEMIDIKNHKTFLKKSACPPEVDAADFFLGGIVLLYARELTIVDYADSFTRNKFGRSMQRVVTLLGSNMYAQWGEAIDAISQDFRLVRVKTYSLPSNVTTSLCDAFEVSERASRIMEGTCLVIVADSEGAFQKIEDIAGQYSGEMLPSTTGTQTQAVLDVLEGARLEDTATLDNCTCVVIRPHIVKGKQAGKIISHIISQGYEISAMVSRQLDKLQAGEFLEIYKDVVPDYNDMLTQFVSGVVIAMEVRAENAVSTFRATAGPWDIEFAKQLRPATIRALYGIDKVRNAIHCTDLEADGVSDV
jgi:nucleoside-diphosphate kinase